MESYQIDEPYPSTEVEGKNLSYAREMLDNVGGRISEMTGISSYYSNSLCGENEEMRQLYHNINRVEMHHLHIFGELARNLGENPLLWSNCGRRRVWWSPSYTDYPMEPCRMLELSIEGEMAAIEKYQQQLKCIDDCHVKSNLKRIIRDEQLHIKLFTNMYGKYT